MTLKVYGPYSRAADKRRHVIFYDTETKLRRTQSYPRFLMEQHLGRSLTEFEEVDHINGDCSDDRLENLQILSIPEHEEKSARELAETVVWYEFICPFCLEDSRIPYRKYKQNQLVRGCAGPYCSRKCAVKAHPPPLRG